MVEKMLLGMKSLENKDSILALVGTGDCSDCDRTRTISVLLRWRGMNGEHIQLTNLECARGILEEPAFWVNGALTLDFVETLPAEMKDIALRFLFSARFAKSRLFC